MSFGSNIWGSSALSDVQMPIDGDSHTNEHHQTPDDMIMDTFSNSMLDADDCDSQGDDDEDYQIRQQVVQNQQRKP